MALRTSKLTISLPRELVTFADQIAKEKRITRSKVVSMCLQDMVEKRRLKSMEEGYLALASEHKEFEELTSTIAHETLPDWQN